MFEVHNLSVFFEEHLIVDKLNFSLNPQELVILSGPNGSGKSTLINGIMGNPSYRLNSNSELKIDGTSIKNLPIDQKVNQGLFFTFQNPVSLPGINLIKLFRELGIINLQNSSQIIKELKTLVSTLGSSENLIIRGINDGFSGGEKKKLEIIMAWYLAKKYIFFDEIDTGLDQKSRQAVAMMINQLKEKGLGCLVVTHSTEFMNLLNKDRIIKMFKGRLEP